MFSTWLEFNKVIVELKVALLNIYIYYTITKLQFNCQTSEILNCFLNNRYEYIGNFAIMVRCNPNYLMEYKIIRIIRSDSYNNFCFFFKTFIVPSILFLFQHFFIKHDINIFYYSYVRIRILGLWFLYNLRVNLRKYQTKLL